MDGLCHRMAKIKQAFPSIGRLGGLGVEVTHALFSLFSSHGFGSPNRALHCRTRRHMLLRLAARSGSRACDQAARGKLKMSSRFLVSTCASASGTARMMHSGQAASPFPKAPLIQTCRRTFRQSRWSSSGEYQTRPAPLRRHFELYNLN